MAGRNRKPAALRLAEGNPGKRPIPIEPQPKHERPRCPKYLGAIGRRVWRDATKQLQSMNLLFRADEQTLAAYCLAAQDIAESEDLLLREGNYCVDCYGNRKRHPALLTREKAMTMLAKLGSLLGLNAVSRARLGQVKDDEVEEELQKFLARSARG